jgi:hypothetical protein
VTTLRLPIEESRFATQKGEEEEKDVCTFQQQLKRSTKNIEELGK